MKNSQSQNKYVDHYSIMYTKISCLSMYAFFLVFALCHLLNHILVPVPVIILIADTFVAKTMHWIL